MVHKNSPPGILRSHDVSTPSIPLCLSLRLLLCCVWALGALRLRRPPAPRPPIPQPSPHPPAPVASCPEKAPAVPTYRHRPCGSWEIPDLKLGNQIKRFCCLRGFKFSSGSQEETPRRRRRRRRRDIGGSCPHTSCSTRRGQWRIGSGTRSLRTCKGFS
ncbi:hypothetical protein VPH35_096927 [Triticum aestivum]